MKNTYIHINGFDKLNEGCHINLPASKSIANRALIIQALADSAIEINNLSTADDTQILQALLRHKSLRKNAGMAGTAFRFMCAFLAMQNTTYLLTGDERMKQRPIAPLVDALRQLGVEIRYVEKEGFPPLQINGEQRKGNAVTVAANISSQFVSALMMIGTCLPQGLTIHLQGKIASRPYIEMTKSLMEYFGVAVDFQDSQIHIAAQEYRAGRLIVESDWSAASYYYSMIALADEGTLTLGGLQFDSWQGDSVVADIYYRLGVLSEFVEDGLYLSKSSHVIDYLEYDFTDCPDLAQTVVATCVGLGVEGVFSGLESLHIKETDRIVALQNEIAKLGWQLIAQDNNEEKWTLQRAKNRTVARPIVINTYNDHRMAMAFAPLALVYDKMTIENPTVVSKSYPKFWEDLEHLGFLLERYE